VTILDLLNCPGVIIRGHWDISTVQDLKVAVERIGIEWHVIPSIEI
jgi:D-mannonate dehydratase